MEMCDPAKESVSGQPLPRLSTRRSEGAPCPPLQVLCVPLRSPISVRAVGGQSPDPTLPLSLTQPPPARFRATPNPSVPPPGVEREEAAPPWVRGWFLDVGGCHTELLPRAESLLPQGGKADLKKKNKTGRRAVGSRGCLPGGCSQGAPGLRGEHASSAPRGWR